tara:strand:- start:127 stop:372 length:246 start_codon:yes stop_codon:yes gene_type:complete
MSDSGPPDLNAHWIHRRRLAYLSLFFSFFQTLMFTLIAYLSPDSLSSLAAVIGWSYGLLTTVLAAYLGTASVEDYIKQRKS